METNERLGSDPIKDDKNKDKKEGVSTEFKPDTNYGDVKTIGKEYREKVLNKIDQSQNTENNKALDEKDRDLLEAEGVDLINELKNIKPILQNLQWAIMDLLNKDPENEQAKLLLQEINNTLALIIDVIIGAKSSKSSDQSLTRNNKSILEFNDVSSIVTDILEQPKGKSEAVKYTLKYWKIPSVNDIQKEINDTRKYTSNTLLMLELNDFWKKLTQCDCNDNELQKQINRSVSNSKGENFWEKIYNTLFKKFWSNGAEIITNVKNDLCYVKYTWKWAPLFNVDVKLVSKKDSKASGNEWGFGGPPEPRVNVDDYDIKNTEFSNNIPWTFVEIGDDKVQYVERKGDKFIARDVVMVGDISTKDFIKLVASHETIEMTWMQKFKRWVQVANELLEAPTKILTTAMAAQAWILAFKLWNTDTNNNTGNPNMNNF